MQNKIVLPDGSVQINYEMSSGDFSMTSSLTFSPEQYETISEEQIEKIMQARFEEWLDSVLNPYVPPEGELNG